MKYPVPVRIPEDLHEQLRVEAKEEGLTMSAVIRRLIIRHCAAKKKQAEARRRPSKGLAVA